MRSTRLVVIDGLVIVLLAAVWLYGFSQTGDGLVFAALGVVIVALLYGVIQRAKALPAQEGAGSESAGPQPAAHPSRRLAALCLALVLLIMVLVVPQVLAARSISVRIVPGVNERGRDTLTNHLVLGNHDLAWVRAELEGAGAVATHSSALAAARGSIGPMRPQVTGMLGADEGLTFQWELRFGWPFTVRKWSETQAIGPGGVRWSVSSGQK